MKFELRSSALGNKLHLSYIEKVSLKGLESGRANETVNGILPSRGLGFRVHRIVVRFWHFLGSRARRGTNEELRVLNRWSRGLELRFSRNWTILMRGIL